MLSSLDSSRTHDSKRYVIVLECKDHGEREIANRARNLNVAMNAAAFAATDLAVKGCEVTRITVSVENEP